MPGRFHPCECPASPQILIAMAEHSISTPPSPPDLRLPEVFTRLWRFPQSKSRGAFLLVAVVVHARARLIPVQSFSITSRTPETSQSGSKSILRFSYVNVFFWQPFDQLHMSGCDPSRESNIPRFHAQCFAVAKMLAQTFCYTPEFLLPPPPHS